MEHHRLLESTESAFPIYKGVKATLCILFHALFGEHVVLALNCLIVVLEEVFVVLFKINTFRSKRALNLFISAIKDALESKLKIIGRI